MDVFIQNLDYSHWYQYDDDKYYNETLYHGKLTQPILKLNCQKKKKRNDKIDLQSGVREALSCNILNNLSQIGDDYVKSL